MSGAILTVKEEYNGKLILKVDSPLNLQENTQEEKYLKVNNQKGINKITFLRHERLNEQIPFYYQ